MPLTLMPRPHVPGENSHQKRIFSQTLSRVKIVENGGLSFSCGRDDDIIQRVRCKACNRISIFLMFPCEWTKTIRTLYLWKCTFKNIRLCLDEALGDKGLP